LPSQGKLYVVGIGPGDEKLLTLKALKVLKNSDYVLGHKSYVNRIRHLVKGEIIESGMGREVERVKLAVELAESNVVSLVSGGDPSVYGMSSLVAEYIEENKIDIYCEVIPGVTALCAASPLLGSIVSGDHAVISLSDLLTPWETIERRLRCALKGDFVIAIYNPSSKRRRRNLIKALRIISEERGDVFLGIVRNAHRDDEKVLVVKTSELSERPEIVDMHTILFIPNSETVLLNGKMVTPRGYGRKYVLR